MQKPLFILAACCLVLLALGSLLVVPSVTTKYARGYSRQTFNSLHSGMTYDEITNAMGLPIDFTVIDEQPDTNGPFGPLRSKEVACIPDVVLRRDTALVMLNYTEKRMGLVYESVELFLAHGKLTTARRYLGRDD